MLVRRKVNVRGSAIAAACAVACGAVCWAVLSGGSAPVTAGDVPASTRPAEELIAQNVLPPLANEPKGDKDAAVPVRYRPWLPPAGGPRGPRASRKDSIHPLRPRPVVDVPAVVETNVALPGAVQLPAAPAVRVTSPDPIHVTFLAASAPDEGRPTLGTDPTLELTRPAALVKEAPPRTKPAPPLMLTIPDPSRRTDEPPTAAPAPDDVPVQTFDLPGAPTLPAGK